MKNKKPTRGSDSIGNCGIVHIYIKEVSFEKVGSI